MIKGHYRRARFVVDAMLGDVAKWLRLLGYDTLYSSRYRDWQLLKIAEGSGRVLVTRDNGLYWRARKRGLEGVYLFSDDIVDKLAELAFKIGIDLRADPSKSRCPECNGSLRVVKDKSRVSSRVPPRALESHNVFYVCSKCGKVYWEGAHWRNIRRIIEEAKARSEAFKRRSKS